MLNEERGTRAPARLLVWPNPFRTKQENPYLELLYSALSEHGIRLSGELELRPGELGDGEIDATHIHWPEHLWLDRNAPLKTRLRRLARLVWVLRQARRHRVCRIWTVHNLQRHEGNDWLDSLGFRMMYRESDLLLCHDETAYDAIKRLVPKSHVLIVPHGNYDGVFPNPRPRARILDELGLDRRTPTLGCLGAIRSYKGLDFACRALEGYPSPIQLIVAGTPKLPRDELQSLRRQMRQMPRAVLIEKELSHAEFADIVSVCDAVLLPYRKITGSGSLLAAWTLGKGVIASDLPFFRGMVAEDRACGELFRFGEADSLRRAVEAHLQIPAIERQRAALRKARAYQWSRCVEPLADFLRSWKGREWREA